MGICLLTALGFAFATPAAAGEIYTYTDENGVTQFTDNWGKLPPKVQERYAAEGRAPKKWKPKKKRTGPPEEPVALVVDWQITTVEQRLANVARAQRNVRWYRYALKQAEKKAAAHKQAQIAASRGRSIAPLDSRVVAAPKIAAKELTRAETELAKQIAKARKLGATQAQIDAL